MSSLSRLLKCKLFGPGFNIWTWFSRGWGGPYHVHYSWVCLQFVECWKCCVTPSSAYIRSSSCAVTWTQLIHININIGSLTNTHTDIEVIDTPTAHTARDVYTHSLFCKTTINQQFFPVAFTLWHCTLVRCYAERSWTTHSHIYHDFLSDSN